MGSGRKRTTVRKKSIFRREIDVPGDIVPSEAVMKKNLEREEGKKVFTKAGLHFAFEKRMKVPPSNGGLRGENGDHQ